MELLQYILRPRKVIFLGVLFSILAPYLSGKTLPDSVITTSAPYNIQYNETVKQAYINIINLKLSQAEKEIAALKRSEPHNLAILHLENLKDFFEIFINENEQTFIKARTRYEQRIALLDRMDIDDPHLKFITGEIHLHWGILHAKFGNFYRAFSSIKKAYHLFDKNIRQYPDFLPNYKSMGILRAALSIVPPEYQWGMKLLSGMQGDLLRGQTDIEYVLNSTTPETFIFYRETLAIYIMLQLHLKNDPDRAWSLIHGININPQTEPLSCFALANLAMRTGNNDLAIHYLENRPQGKDYMEFHYLEFMLGEAYLRKLDKRAINHLQNFVKNYQGHNYLKDAYQKIAWHVFINGNENDYLEAMDDVLSHGTAIIDADKTAEKDAKLRIAPNKTLLKSQLLFDGGYYQKAHLLLVNNRSEFTHSEKDGYEYIYRLARVLHQMERYSDATVYYKETYDIGINRREYYACNAALQLGLIAEGQGKIDEAKSWYHKCLNLTPGTYSAGLHRAAKAGLEGLK